MTAAPGFDRAEFRPCGSAEDAFADLKGLVEASGVFVLLAGDCQHWSTATEVSVLRGLAIADALAPFIAIPLGTTCLLTLSGRPSMQRQVVWRRNGLLGCAFAELISAVTYDAILERWTGPRR